MHVIDGSNREKHRQICNGCEHKEVSKKSLSNYIVLKIKDAHSNASIYRLVG